jgi:hypothetical protein
MGSPLAGLPDLWDYKSRHGTIRIDQASARVRGWAGSRPIRCHSDGAPVGPSCRPDGSREGVPQASGRQSQTSWAEAVKPKSSWRNKSFFQNCKRRLTITPTARTPTARKTGGATGVVAPGNSMGQDCIAISVNRLDHVGVRVGSHKAKRGQPRAPVRFAHRTRPSGRANQRYHDRLAPISPNIIPAVCAGWRSARRSFF